MFIKHNNNLPYNPQRIICLVPSLTELLYDLGLHDQVVGITKFCIHPKQWQQTKQIIGGTKNIQLNKISLLQPDLIIASKEENIREQVEALAENFPVWLTDVHNLDSAIQMIKDIGALTKTNDEAVKLADTIRQSFNCFKKPITQLNTAYLIWRQPYMTVGGDTFIHDMLVHAGCTNIFATATRYPIITIKALQQLHCELLLLSTEPYPFNSTHLAALQLQLPNTKILLVDGELFSWYGSRLIYSVDYFITLMNTISKVK